MTYLRPVVAEVSPNLYSAAKSANLNGAELNQINEMSGAIKMHRELVKLGGDAAKQKFSSLEATAQEQLKFLFKDTDYSVEPESVTRRFFGSIGNVAHVFASPLIGLFKLGGQYNRMINTPYKVARQVAQGEDLFSGKVWTDAWNGTEMYDQGALKDVTAYFGEADVFVAKGLLAGKTPGEILESYGSVDPKILESIKKAYDEESDFTNVMEGVKYTQISPGRDIARMFDTKPPSSGGIAGDYLKGRNQNVSGVIDFVYQIAIDPLTWLTGGLSKGVTKGDRIAKTVTEMLDKGITSERAIDTIFKAEPKLYEFWDKGLGPAIRTYSEAPTAAAKSQAFDDIARRFPGYNNRAAIEALARKDEHLPEGVVDAASAQKYFEQASNLHLLLAGRVDGLTYMRNGVAVARNRRLGTDGLRSFLDSVFNNTAGRRFLGAETTGRTTKELDEVTDKAYNALVNSQNALERMRNPATSDLKVVIEASKEIKGWKRIGQMASRSPAGLEVRVGEGAVSTAANFTARARQVLPKDMAQALTVKFLEANISEQYVILRNLDAATMYSMGLGGDVRGLKLMEEILDAKYATKSGFAVKREESINPSHAKHMPDGSYKQTDDGMYVDGMGSLHPYQARGAVASLPYDVIGSMIWDIKSKKNLINAVGGATQGAFSKKIVDAWSILTLFPRLGIRSAIDEGIMFMLAAPGKDMRAYAVFQQGRKLSRVTRAYTGSDSGTGFFGRGVRKALEIGGKRSQTVARWGKAVKISPEEAIDIQRRVEVIQDLAQRLGTEPELLTNLEKRMAIVDETFKVYSRYLTEDTEKYLRQAFIYQPDALTSVANSIVARSGVSGQFGRDAQGIFVTPSNLSLAMDDMAVKFNSASREIDIATLAEREQALVHFEKFVKQFAGNKFKVNDKTILNPAEIFFRYNGLRPDEIDPKTGKEMFELALDAGMRSVGFEIDATTGLWKIVNNEHAKAFIEDTANTVAQREMKRSDADIARIQLARMFADMFTTFHGGPNKFNEELMDVMSRSYSGLRTMLRDKDTLPTWNQAAARLDLDTFADATVDNRLKGIVNSQLGIGDYADTESMFRRYGNDMMEIMDAQVNGIFRQPAVMVGYTSLRKKYASLERNMARQIYEQRTGKVFAHTMGQAVKDADMKFAIQLAEKHFTEVATREAADTILKYADNPAIRSNFAYAARTMGRYYRATEDFYRRIYRLKDVSPRVLYRMRLAHLGLGATGSIHTDANGDQYVMMPMDNVIFAATDSAMRILTGKDTSYSQPQFSEFTLKLRMMNPSFSQDAGVPTLSGPIAGLGVIAFKNILGSVPGAIPFVGKYVDAPLEKFGERVDTYALGNIGENMDVRRAIVPASLQKIWSMLPFDEQSRQEATAAQQAIAYNAANGLHMNPNATDEEKAAYLKNIRISAHNIIVLRNLLGLIAPVAPTIQDSKGIPDYLKDVGITSLRSEFFEILNSISKDQSGEVEDPYELALVTFIGDNPGKLIYTVSPTTKQTKVVIKNTDKLKDWAIQNKNLVATYGESAYIFAPQIGEFNAATYNWIKAAGLVDNKTLEKYYDDLLVAQDKQTYYEIAKAEKDILSRTSDVELRANIINEATNARDALKNANPLLTPALIGEGNNIGGESVMLDKIEAMISDNSTPVDGGTRRRMAMAIKLMRDFISLCEDPGLNNAINKVEIKAARKAQVEAALQELMVGDLYVREANRAVFRSILGFYSRDSYYASKELR
jgi:hypothetical protein